MRILSISDLHIGKKDEFDIFGWEENEFIELLNAVIEYFNIKLVVLNGDTYELMKYKYEEIVNAYPKLCKLFENKMFIKVRGNHDIIKTDLLNSFLIVNNDGKKILFEHGHNADFINGTRIGRFISNLSFKIIKYLTKNEKLLKLYYKIVEFDDQINRIPRKYNSIKYLHYALKRLAEVDVIVLGHTHKLEYHKTYYLNKKKKYLNTGSCTMGRFQGIILDTETLKYETIKLNKKSKQKDFIEQLEGNIVLK
jgi:predicted phosphodiesterase